MKSVNKKVLAIVLVALMILPVLVACGTPTNNGQSTSGNNNQETDRMPTVERKDYQDAEFTALYCADTFNEGYFFLDEEDRRPGNDMDDKIYERMINVEEHLGVKIIAENGGNFQEYTTPLKNSIATGDDSYQMIMTHVYYEVASLITSNYLRDFNEFESIQLEGEHWNYQLMEDLSINDKMYCGYNDFCLANCYMIGFNKEMIKDYASTIGDLYQQVRDRQWTIDKLIEYSALVSNDNGDGVWDDQDTYGFACFAWVPLVSFQHGCDIPIVKENADGEFYVSPMVDNKDKITALDEKIYNFMNDDSTYTWAPPDFGGNTTQLHLKSGRVMFEIVNNYQLVTTTEDEVKIGVLPYPLWNTEQKDYKTLSWNGVLGIPTTVKEEDMVGDVIEMLAWYSEPVNIAFYENLLGAKVAEAPEDVQMLDIVWGSQVSDVGLVFSSSSNQMDCLLYAIPHHVTANRPAYASYYRQNHEAAKELLNKMFETK